MGIRDNVRNLKMARPGLFTPTVSRIVREGPEYNSATFGSSVSSPFVDSTLGHTGSFKYSMDGEGLRSTQQLNVDWSDFAAHTFFNSAQVKTNVALDKILNEYPFDGTKVEFETYLDNLTGFEKWVFDQFPKNLGYLFLSGTSPAESGGGSFVRVKDTAGAAYPGVSRVKTGGSVLGPESTSMTLEFHLWLPLQANDSSVIVDKVAVVGAEHFGFLAAVQPTVSTTDATVSFLVVSGAVSDQVDIPVTKGQWTHLCWTWDRTPGVETITGYRDLEAVATTLSPIEFGPIITSTVDLLIGSGSTVSGLFTPDATLSGAIDEFRLWHSVRSRDELKLFAKKAIFAQEDLVLYLKFNEPSGSNSALVIDHSGRSLHGRLSTDAVSLGVRNTPNASVAGRPPIVFERIADSPVLFPSYGSTLSLQTALLQSASQFDRVNPNLITRLVPAHYFLEGQAQDALSTEEGTILDEIISGVEPRSTALGGTQVLLMLLYTWAKYFDEMKLFIQAFSTLPHVDYDNTDTVPDQFLRVLGEDEGISLPPLFDGSTIEQFIEGENVLSDVGTIESTLQRVRNQIWRRILINFQDVIRSKGTLHSVKSFIRSVGVDPDNNLRIREYGGPTARTLEHSRDFRSEISSMLDFISGGYIASPGLSASRVEPGYPEPSQTLSDALLTSGSWTYEATYRFTPAARQAASQSLVRLLTTGSLGEGLLANLVAVSGSNPVLTLFARPNSQASAPRMTLAISGADVFDGDKWTVMLSRLRGDSFGSTVSSSYHLRVAKANFGEVLTLASGSVFFDESANLSNATNLWQSHTTTLNASGAFFAIGESDVDSGVTVLLNDTVNVPESTARVTGFLGRVGHMRFYSRGVEHREFIEHTRFFRSVGARTPSRHFNFVTTATGSWGRLRVDASTDQPVTRSNSSGEIYLTDFSQNGFTMTGSGFLQDSGVIVPERFWFNNFSPKFDQASSIDKVRVRGFSEFSNVLDTPWAQVSPVHQIEPSESPTDNTRVSVDFSVVDALDQDIMTIFGSLEELDTMLGAPELVYAETYPGLQNLRDSYFHKLTDKLQLRRFFEFFKWMDTNIGTYIAQLLPHNSRFFGTNFVIESHVLERSKVVYNSFDIYLGDNTRDSLRDTLLVRLISGDFSRY